MRLICVKPKSHNQKVCDLAAVILSGVAILLVFIALVAATTAVVRSLCTAEDAVDEEVDYPKSMQPYPHSLTHTIEAAREEKTSVPKEKQTYRGTHL